MAGARQQPRDETEFFTEISSCFCFKTRAGPAPA